MRDSYQKLKTALDEAAAARACIAQNRGYEKDQAREGYDEVISSEVAPALSQALEDASGDIESRDIEKLGHVLLKLLEKRTTI